MTITIHDPMLVDEIKRAGGLVELCDAAGHSLGVLCAEGLGKLPPGVTSPFTREEIAARRQDRTGRPMADVMRAVNGR